MELRYRDRLDEASFVIGFVERRNSEELSGAINGISIYHGNFDLNRVFGFAPFNDSVMNFKNFILSSERGSKPNRIRLISHFLSDLIVLASDFAVPCCYDGRAYYHLKSKNELCLKCDRCDASYDLYGSRIEATRAPYAYNGDFERIASNVPEKIWPYHSRLAGFLASNTS